MMRPHIRFVLLHVALPSLVMMGGGAFAAVDDILLKLPRHAYYRGESIPLTLSVPEEVKDGYVEQWHVDDPAHAGWMLMGPDRCKEVSWIILSRAPKFIGYYYGSACSPLKYNRPEDQFRVPHATSDAILEMSQRVYQPFGQMITRLAVARRRIAVLSSQASRLYGKSPRTSGYPNEQIYGFYSVLAMAHLDGDVVFDEHVEQGCLNVRHCNEGLRRRLDQEPNAC